jgi:hypothetical protein
MFDLRDFYLRAHFQEHNYSVNREVAVLQSLTITRHYPIAHVSAIIWLRSRSLNC